MKKRNMNQQSWAFEILTMVLVILKITVMPALSWLWVLAPVWIPFAIAALLRIFKEVDALIFKKEKALIRDIIDANPGGLRCDVCGEMIADDLPAFYEKGKPKGEGKVCCSLKCIGELASRDNPGKSDETIFGGEWTIESPIVEKEDSECSKCRENGRKPGEEKR